MLGTVVSLVPGMISLLLEPLNYLTCNVTQRHKLGDCSLPRYHQVALNKLLNPFKLQRCKKKKPISKLLISGTIDILNQQLLLWKFFLWTIGCFSHPWLLPSCDSQYFQTLSKWYLGRGGGVCGSPPLEKDVQKKNVSSAVLMTILRFKGIPIKSKCGKWHFHHSSWLKLALSDI